MAAPGRLDDFLQRGASLHKEVQVASNGPQIFVGVFARLQLVTPLHWQLVLGTGVPTF